MSQNDVTDVRISLVKCKNDVSNKSEIVIVL